MSRQSLFTLHNLLPDRDDACERFELNPAVVNPAVVDEHSQRAFALATLCIGPTLETDGHPLRLELVYDGESIELAALEQRAEALDDTASLTVALFDVSRSLLVALARASEVEARLASPRAAISRIVSQANRQNLLSFVEALAEAGSEPRDLPVASAAG